MSENVLNNKAIYTHMTPEWIRPTAVPTFYIYGLKRHHQHYKTKEHRPVYPCNLSAVSRHHAWLCDLSSGVYRGLSSHVRYTAVVDILTQI